VDCLVNNTTFNGIEGENLLSPDEWENEMSDASDAHDRAMLTEMLRRGASRRDVIRWTMAAGATATAAGALVLGAENALAATPKKGGHYKAGVHDGNTSDTLDPATFSSVGMIQLAHTNRNFLTEITPTNEIGPDVSESWEASKDATTWTFKLREGVEFHNGKTFTAKDAVDSLNYHRGKESKSAAKALLSDVKNIRADGDNHVVIELNGGNADLPFVLSDYHLVMMPSDGEGNVDWESGIGTGPYELDEFEPGIYSRLSRNPNYFKEDRAHFDEVTMLILSDAVARNNALVTGEVHSISEAESKTVNLLKRRKGIVVEEMPSGAHCTMPMFCDTAPFDDVDMRLALKYAIDREQALEKAIGGFGVLGNDHPIGPTLPYWADLPQREYDTDKAKFHLKKAGHSSIEIDLSTSDGAFLGAVDTALIFQDSARPAGININVRREPADGYWSNVWLKKPFSVVSWGARPTPDVMFSLAYKKGAEWNESHWENERFNAVLLEAKAELDDSKRKEMYREMMELCRDDGGTIVPFFRNRVYARSEKVMHGPNMSGNWELDGARSAERWWFADT